MNRCTYLTCEYTVSVCVYQVVTLRMVHEKLLRLLPGGKQQALTSARVFEPFSGLSPLHYNPYTEVRLLLLLRVHVYVQGLDCVADDTVIRLLSGV